MGDLFQKPRNKSYSTLYGQQESLLDPLSSFANRGLTNPDPALAKLKRQLLNVNSDQATNLARETWQKGFMDPIVNSFNYDIAPRINSEFSKLGGTLSSRRTKTLSDAFTNLTAQASGQFAQMLPQIEEFPLRQTLGQIEGLSRLTDTQYLPFNEALRFALQPTRTIGQTAAGPGWGLLNSGIGAAGFALGGGFGGGGSSSPTPSAWDRSTLFSDYFNF